MIILLTTRYSKYINVDANSAHQRFCELCSKHTARNASFFAKTRQSDRNSRDGSRKVQTNSSAIVYNSRAAWATNNGIHMLMNF